MGEISEGNLISELKEKQQVLCILTSRKRVQRVYEALKGEKCISPVYLHVSKAPKNNFRRDNKGTEGRQAM